MIDYTLSAAAARAVAAKPKECYINAWRAQRLPEMRGHSAQYIEGWIAFPPGIVTEHGWLELEDGTIVDPTLHDRHDVAYFAGRHWDEEEAVRAVFHGDNHGKMPLFMHDSRHGSQNAPMWEAYVQAQQYCGTPAEDLAKLRAMLTHLKEGEES